MEENLRFFNIAGPCNPVEHYMLPALERLPEVYKLIRKKQYFVLHAPRQSGKTTAIKALAGEINAKEEKVALYCSLESAENFGREEGLSKICTVLCKQIQGCTPLAKFHQEFSEADKQRVKEKMPGDVGELLTGITRKAEKPLVVFFDEVDCLQDELLISFLRQLRDGYVNRDEIPFPSSIALVGLRNIRDYKVKIRPEAKSLGTASPFNIIAKASTLRNFTLDEIRTLYNQRTAETGQIFEEAAVEKAYEYTCGQPWLVNALARYCTEEIRNDTDFSTVTAEDMHDAKEQIIRERGTHIDSLMDKMREERVRRIMEPVLLGEKLAGEIISDDISYVMDLGLLKYENNVLVPSNRMYCEILFRYMSFELQNDIKATLPQNVWIKDGEIDMDGLMTSFQEYWRENASEQMIPGRFREAYAVFALQAFLQRVVNGGGEIGREVAANSGRVDIMVKYNDQKYLVEAKTISNYNKSHKAAHEQLLRYMDTYNKDEGWLLIFDPDFTKPWEGRIRREELVEGGKKLHLVFC